MKKWRLNVYSILHYFLNNGDIHLGKRRKKDLFPFLKNFKKECAEKSKEKYGNDVKIIKVKVSYLI